MTVRFADRDVHFASLHSPATLWAFPSFDIARVGRVKLKLCALPAERWELSMRHVFTPRWHPVARITLSRS